MKRAIPLITFWLVITTAVVWLELEVTEARSSKTVTQPFPSARCFRDSKLSESLATLKLQAGPEVGKVFRSLLARARATPRCRTQLVQALIKSMDQASKNITNPYENYFFFENGADLLTELKATEALDLLIANIELNDQFPSSLSDFPALVAILRIGQPAIRKLQVVLENDSDPGRRKFAAFAVAYIGGSQARRALTSASSRETDPCVKTFLQVSLRAFDNRVKPNHISPELKGRWLSAFYCP